MKNYFVIISIMVVFLIPLNASAFTDEMLEEWLLNCCKQVEIEDKSQPHAYGYSLIRNSNGELGGVVPVTASTVLDNPLLAAFLNEQPVIENVAIEGTQFAVSVFQIDVDNHPDFCFNKIGMGQGIINGKCFFYSFKTQLDAAFATQTEVRQEGLYYEANRVTAFAGVHHGFISEAGDGINVIWATLVPAN